MKEYKPFVKDLQALVAGFQGRNDLQWKEKAISSINGLASHELRSRVPLEERRSSGAFFTDTLLGSEILNSYKLTFGNRVVFYDPACGAGNLLISAKSHYEKQLSQKRVRLEVSGTDIHSEFIDASKLRLSIFDLLHQNPAKDYSEQFIVTNGLQPNLFYESATHIFTNPPFNQIEASRSIKWATGKVSAAALFIDAIINNTNPGTEIIAILPDVLRSGSRYQKWRAHVSKYCEIDNIKLLGQFDSFTDVDVFSVMLKKKNLATEESNHDWNTSVVNPSKVSDFFDVSVGTVVDNRDPHEGIKRPYLISRGLKGWTELRHTDLKRKHKGKMIKSPFVVVKRTSRHGDNHRAIATLVVMPEPVYVDNHLIVLKPLKGGIKACKKLLKSLKSQSTDKWIDDQIRCRHLTVKVVAEIPFFDL
ncbi:MAG: N-6 DNA methylase [Filimonas sp.]|nr:N-6 DNA methylase [Filimonas sp.]